MKVYARVQDGLIVETIKPSLDEDGHPIALEDLYHPDFIATLVDVTDTVPAPLVGWNAVKVDGAWQFAPPPVED